MKKLTSIILCALLVLVSGIFAACNSKKIAAVTSGSPYLASTEKSFGELFTTKNCTITENASSPKYENIEVKHGIKISTTTDGGEVSFTNKLDLSQNKKTDPLLEFLVMPQLLGTEDFYQITVTLTDAMDSNNKLRITIYRGTYDPLISVVKTAAQGQVLAGYNAKAKMMQTETDRGTPIYSSFSGKGVLGNPGSVSLFYDYRENALYARPGVYAELENSDLVCRFGDPRYVQREWSGFTTGEVYLSVAINSLKRDKGEVLLLNLNGQKLASPIVDTKAPCIITNTEGNKEVPFGEKGRPYPIFSANGFDEMEGELTNDKIAIKVYKDSETESNLIVSGNAQTLKSFTPAVEGNYILIYSAKDTSGQKRIVTYKIEVKDALEKLDYTLMGEIPTSAFVGERIVIPFGETTGGSGVKKITTKVVKMGAGEIAVKDSAFDLTLQGVYSVTITAEDYLRQTKALEFNINVTTSDVPLMEKPLLPKYLISGKSTVFSDFKAADLVSTPGKPQEATRKGINIYSKTGVLLQKLDYSTRRYTPNIQNGESVIVEYWVSANYNSEKKAIVKTEILVKETEQISDYFIRSGNFDVLAKETTTLYQAKQEGAELEFINALSTTGFNLTFDVPVEYNQFNKIAITLTDSFNPLISVKLTIDKSLSSVSSMHSKLLINNSTEPLDILGSFFGTTNNSFSISLAGRSIIDGSSKTITNITDTIYGQHFTGFPSEKVYLKIGFSEIEGKKAGIEIGYLLNQIICDIDGDYICPLISISEQIEREKNFGDSVKIPAAKSFDVLDQDVTLTVSVMDKTGNYLIDHQVIDKDLYFTARSYGTYQVEYEASDSAGNVLVQSFAIDIRDTIAPKLTLLGEIPKTVKIGQKIKLPGATVSDNVSVNIKVYMFVTDKYGKISIVDNNIFIFTEKGKYVLRYYASDNDFNYVMTDYIIEAK